MVVVCKGHCLFSVVFLGEVVFVFVAFLFVYEEGVF